jgi:ornithine carbamoyltransferase
MPTKHVLSVADLNTETVGQLVDRSIAYASGANGRPLAGKVVGLYFRGSSTRTRTAFTVGSIQLGANVVTYGPNDLQISTGETIDDTARVLAGYLDALVIRTNRADAEIKAFSAQNQMSIINAMSELEHPTQAIADLSALKEHFGKLDGIHVLYLGEGNNTAGSLALAAALTPGMRLTLVTPEGYGLPSEMLSKSLALAEENGSVVEQQHDLESLPRVDAVYTARWQTMGEPKKDLDWLDKFKPYCVTPDLMSRVSKNGSTIFMHDLPAVRGGDVRDEVLDGPQSIAFRQARHKLFSAMAVLEWCLAA